MRSLIYIAEINIPSKSGYVQHVLKMCDAFAKVFNNNVKLITFSNAVEFKKIKFDYTLKNNFKIFSVLKKERINFFSRLRLAFFSLNLWKKNTLIITRSPLTSVIFSLFNKKNILEIHHTYHGLTSFIFNLLNFLKLNRKSKYIVINKSIAEKMHLQNYIILDDCVDLKDFMDLGNCKIKYDFTYTGSLYKGKGIELIIFLAKTFKNRKFHVFGEISTLENKYQYIIKKYKNIIIEGFKNYNEIPYILRSSRFLLMPYLTKVNVNSKNLEVSNYMSPLKLFDYLASKKIIIASNLPAYSHILKNNINSILVDAENLNDWKVKLTDLIKNEKKYNFLKKAAFECVQNYTWEKRAKKILNYYI
jgi:glycosyltransferase involved in cell wall biosynthesis